MPKSRKKKKRNKKVIPPKKRPTLSLWGEFQVTGPHVPQFKFEGGTVKCPNNESESLFTEYGYETHKGKIKITSRVFNGNNNQFTFKTIKANLTHNFDYIIGVDTNSNSFEDYKISITAAFLSEKLVDSRDNILTIYPHLYFVFKNVRPDLNPERLGWYYLMCFFNFFKDHPPIDGSDRFILFTDSDYADHQDINLRKLPYFKSQLLKDNISLGYASSDVAHDMPNKLLRTCDKGANAILNQIKKGEIKIEEHWEHPCDDHDGYTIIRPQPP